MKSLIFIFKQSSIIFIEIKKYTAPRRYTLAHSLASRKKSPAIQRDMKIQTTMKSRHERQKPIHLTHNNIKTSRKRA